MADAFVRVLEQKVLTNRGMIERIEKRFDTFEESLSNQMKDLFNHQSSKLSVGTSATITILSALVVGLISTVITYVLTK